MGQEGQCPRALNTPSSVPSAEGGARGLTPSGLFCAAGPSTPSSEGRLLPLDQMAGRTEAQTGWAKEGSVS